MKKPLFSLGFLLLFSIVSAASEPEIWSVNTRADILKGDAHSVSVDANGTITLAPKLTEIFKTEQPYIWSSAVDASGNIYLGTGSDGRIYKVGANGSGSLLTDLDELNVTALAVVKSGAIFAATSPDGKVYQIDASGKATVYFDPKEKYIWSIAVMNDGSLAIGTGESGKIYRVRSANASPTSSLLFDSSETHIISLAVDKAGNLFAGTDSNGLVLRFGSDGKPFAVLDSPLREIHELAVGPDGSVYALALGESASVAKTPELAATAPPESKTTAAEKSNIPKPEPPPKSRYDLTGAKTAVYRIAPDGGSEILFSSTTVTGFSIYAHQTGNGVMLGTSDKGRIYSIRNDGRESLALQTDANQISTVFSSGTNLYATSSNQGKLYKIGPETIAEGIYESAVLDAKSTASWGNIWWRSTGVIRIETRSGNTESPDETWSSWEIVRTEAMRGRVASPASQFMQWRAKLVTSGQAASLSEASVAFLPKNIAPEVLSITILPANVGLIANPPPQIDPNIELSGIDPQAFGIPPQVIAPRRVYLRGARAFQWTTEDRNGDKLVFDVYFKEMKDAEYKLLRADLAETFYSLDGLSLADGRYTLKIAAKDSPGNPVGQSLSGELVSEPFDIHNSQPAVTVLSQPVVSGNNVRVSFSASDRWGYIVRAEYSVNGSDWKTVYADDGISDGPEEKYTFDVPLPSSGEHSITLRVFDSSGNAGNARVVVRK
ncbi:MAG: hypothetical protein ACRD6X_06580 [Pyrinomonadaceae bacterium]